jgi:hypothetical protein
MGRKTEYPKETTFFHIYSSTQSYENTLFIWVLAQKRLYDTLEWPYMYTKIPLTKTETK